MSEFNVKDAMEHIHITYEMQEEIIMNVTDKVESGKRNKRNWKKIAASAAVVALAAGMISVPVKALVQDYVRERMENIPQEEVQDIENMIQAQETDADGFSREYTDEENERSKELWQLYDDGFFPEETIQQVDSAEEVIEGTLCYIRDTGVFNLPDREMTDEELLEIIDFQHEMSYAIEQSAAAQEARAEHLAEKNRLREIVEAAGGLSEEEAIEIVRAHLEEVLGEEMEKLELTTDIYGCGAFITDISNQTYFEHEGDVAYIVDFSNPNEHYGYTYTIDAVDGSILYIAD